MVASQVEAAAVSVAVDKLVWMCSSDKTGIILIAGRILLPCPILTRICLIIIGRWCLILVVSGISWLCWWWITI